MLKVIRGQLNLLSPTATELATSTNPMFRFEIKNIQKNTNQTIILQNISTHTDRSDLFELTEGEGEEIELDKGQYSYEIFDENNTLCEVGMLRVYDLNDEEVKAYNVAVTNKVYEG
jgi:hypothetical protein